MGVEVSGDLVTSSLLVNNAVVGDAGSYSCTLPVFGNMDFPRARANVHLIYGKATEHEQQYNLSVQVTVWLSTALLRDRGNVHLHTEGWHVITSNYFSEFLLSLQFYFA